MPRAILRWIADADVDGVVVRARGLRKRYPPAVKIYERNGHGAARSGS